VILVHERLAIVDPASGAQPLRSRDGELALAVNGEIYNHRELRAASATTSPPLRTAKSSTRCIAKVTPIPAADLCNKLNGIFAFALWDGAAQRYLIARDPIGVCPLYWGHDRVGRTVRGFGDEGAGRLCADVARFPPGHVYDSASGNCSATTTSHGATMRIHAGHEVAAGDCGRRSSRPCIGS
jgi:asparagine synthase (glutamine-hydrolysing)